MHTRVIVAGAGKGIGLAIVKECLSKGIYVSAISRNCKNLEAIGATYRDQLEIIKSDLTIFKNYPEIISTLKRNEQPIDFVVYNAGLLINKSFKEIGIEDIESSYRTNVYVPFFLTQELLKLNDKMHHIYISSMGGVQGSVKFPGLSAYSTSKAAVACLAEMLAVEYKDTQHTFNCLALGSVQTEMLNKAFPGYKAEVTPERMAKYIVNFAKEAPGVINGKIIEVAASNP